MASRNTSLLVLGLSMLTILALAAPAHGALTWVSQLDSLKPDATLVNNCVEVRCPAGTTLISGGCEVHMNTGAVATNAPNVKKDGWRCCLWDPSICKGANCEARVSVWAGCL